MSSREELLASLKEQVLSHLCEDTGEEIKRKIIDKHAADLPDSAREHLHGAKSYSTKTMDHLIDHHGVSPGKAKSVLTNIKNDMSSSLSSSKTSSRAEKVSRALGQKWIGPRGNR